VKAPAATAPAPAPVELPDETAMVRPSSQATIHFEGEHGTEGRMRVALHGENLKATILTSDPMTAQRMESEVSALQQSLRDRGFASASVSVRAGGDATQAQPADTRGNAQNQDHDRARNRDDRPRTQQQPDHPDPRGSRRGQRQKN
jgi:hypothetical protein